MERNQLFVLVVLEVLVITREHLGVVGWAACCMVHSYTALMHDCLSHHRCCCCCCYFCCLSPVAEYSALGCFRAVAGDHTGPGYKTQGGLYFLCLNSLKLWSFWFPFKRVLCIFFNTMENYFILLCQVFTVGIMFASHLIHFSLLSSPLCITISITARVFILHHHHISSHSHHCPWKKK